MNDKQMRVAATVMFVTAAFVITMAAILPGRPLIAPKTKLPMVPCPPNCEPMLFASPAAKPQLPVPVPSPGSVAVVRMR